MNPCMIIRLGNTLNPLKFLAGAATPPVGIDGSSSPSLLPRWFSQSRSLGSVNSKPLPFHGSGISSWHGDRIAPCQWLRAGRREGTSWKTHCTCPVGQVIHENLRCRASGTRLGIQKGKREVNSRYYQIRFWSWPWWRKKKKRKKGQILFSHFLKVG